MSAQKDYTQGYGFIINDKKHIMISKYNDGKVFLINRFLFTPFEFLNKQSNQNKIASSYTKNALKNFIKFFKFKNN